MAEERVRSVTRGNLGQISELFGRLTAAASRPDFPFAPALPSLRARSEGAGMVTASAGRAARVRRRLPRALAARRPRGLGAGQGRRQAHGQTAKLLRPNARSG